MNDQLLDLVTAVIERMNETRDEKLPVDDVADIILYGDAGVFDSMHLVSFLAAVEEAVEDEYDLEISLTSEKAVSLRVSPFSKVSRLIKFMDGEIQIARDGGQDAADDVYREASDELARQGG